MLNPIANNRTDPNLWMNLTTCKHRGVVWVGIWPIVRDSIQYGCLDQVCKSAWRKTMDIGNA